ncbi:MAG: hypothetical protein QNJ45_16410 [Ardenticatenaceae bacterium]|nr:hypothetical protein [Ardenticatenaceae bacterium]
MEPINLDNLQFFLTVLAGIMITSFLLFLIMIYIGVQQLRHLDIPEDATFIETLRLTPFSIVLAVDLLDLSLDVLAAPVAWVLLDRLGLKALRGLSAVEAVIPGTQFIPTLTACWLGVRVLGLR